MDLSPASQQQALFGKIEPVELPVAQRNVAKRRADADNEDRIASLRRVAEIEANVNTRGKRWAMRKLVEREKYVLKAKVALNKMLRIIQDRIRQEQNFFMEGVFSAAAEGDWELEELLKSSARNSLSNESRFSTILRNRNSSSGYNRTSYQSSSGNPLKGLDNYLQQVLDKASHERETKNVSYSMRSGQNEYRHSTKAVKKNSDEDRYSLGKQIANPGDSYLTKVEKVAYNTVAKKTENILNQTKEREGKKIERLLLLEREFTQLARIMKGIKMRSMLITFNELSKIHLLHTQAMILRDESRDIDDDQVKNDDCHATPGWCEEGEDLPEDSGMPKETELACLRLDNALTAVVHRFQNTALYRMKQCQVEVELQARIIQRADLNAEDDWKQDLAIALTGEDEDMAEVVHEIVLDPHGNRYLTRTLMLNHFLNKMFSSRRQAMLISLFQNIYQIEEVKMERSRGLNILNYYSELVLMRFSIGKLAENCLEDQERERGYMTLYNVIEESTGEQLREALHILFYNKERVNNIRECLGLVEAAISKRETSWKASGFKALKSNYNLANIKVATQRLSFLITRSEVIQMATAMKTVTIFGLARVKLSKMLEISYCRTRECMLADLVTGMIDAQYQKQKRLEGYDVEDWEASENECDPCEAVQVIEWEHVQQERTLVRGLELPHASKPYSVLPLKVAMHEFRTKCSAFGRIAQRARHNSDKEVAMNMLFDSLPAKMKQDSFSRIRKHKASENLTILSGEIFDSHKSVSHKSIKLSQLPQEKPKKRFSQLKSQKKMEERQGETAPTPQIELSEVLDQQSKPPRTADKAILVDRVYTLSSANDAENTFREKSDQKFEYEPVLSKKRLYPKEPTDLSRPSYGSYVSYKLSTRLQTWGQGGKPRDKSEERPVRETAKFAPCTQEDSIDRLENSKHHQRLEDFSSKYVIQTEESPIRVFRDYEVRDQNRGNVPTTEPEEHLQQRTIQKSFLKNPLLDSSSKTLQERGIDREERKHCTICIKPHISICCSGHPGAGYHTCSSWRSDFMRHRHCRPHTHVTTHFFPPQNLNSPVEYHFSPEGLSSPICEDFSRGYLTNLSSRQYR